MTHRVGAISQALGLDCRGCHEDTDPSIEVPADSTAHHAQQLLYTGLLPEGGDATGPSPKFVARIRCTDCHSAASMDQPAGSAERLDAIRRECVACGFTEQARDIGSRVVSIDQPFKDSSTRFSKITFGNQ